MNTNDLNEKRASMEGEPFGDDDHVEVLVEDLFIEEYPEAAPQLPSHSRRERALAMWRPRGKRLVMGLLAIGGLVVMKLLLLGVPRRRRSRLSRMFGFAR